MGPLESFLWDICIYHGPFSGTYDNVCICNITLRISDQENIRRYSRIQMYV